LIEDEEAKKRVKKMKIGDKVDSDPVELWMKMEGAREGERGMGLEKRVGEECGTKREERSLEREWRT